MINRPDLHAASALNFDVFKGCFPRGCVPTDLDGIIEIGGHFLVIEWKNPGGKVSGGQQWTFEDMVKLKSHTVMVLHGLLDKTGMMERVDKIILYNPTGSVTTYEKKDASVDKVRYLCQKWSEYAERTPPAWKWMEAQKLVMQGVSYGGGMVTLACNGHTFVMTPTEAQWLGLSLRDNAMSVDHTARVMVDGKGEETRA